MEFTLFSKHAMGIGKEWCAVCQCANVGAPVVEHCVVAGVLCVPRWCMESFMDGARTQKCVQSLHGDYVLLNVHG